MNGPIPDPTPDEVRDRLRSVTVALEGATAAWGYMDHGYASIAVAHLIEAVQSLTLAFAEYVIEGKIRDAVTDAVTGFEGGADRG